MDETEIETKPQKAEENKRRGFSALVLLACVLSAGSLIWTTYSLLDLYQVGGIDLANIDIRDISIVGLSAAATADIAWSLTMIADFRGVRLMLPKMRGKEINALPWIGWAEVLFVAGLLAFHGTTVGNNAAMFAGALPILTKVGWMMALADLKDPTAPTLEQMEKVNAIKQNANVKLETIKASEKAHRAELEAQRRKNERILEDQRAEAERARLAQQTEFELEQDRLRGENAIKLERMRNSTELQMETVRARASIEDVRDEHEFSMSIRRRPQTIVGQTVPRSGLSYAAPLGITDGTEGSSDLDQALAELTPSQRERVLLAHHWYTVDAEHGGAITKAAFCKEVGIKRPAGLSEATGLYPAEWFVERGLATWMTTQD